MDNVNLKHYIDILKSGRKIVAKKFDDSELDFYIGEDGTLISEDEHGLTTTTGLSYIELYYVLESIDGSGDYMLEEAESEVTSGKDFSQFENKFERAKLICDYLRNNGYDLDDIYENYNVDAKTRELIDTLSPEILDLLESKTTAKANVSEACERQSDINTLLGNLFDSGRVAIWGYEGLPREYVIEGGVLKTTNSEGKTLEGFLAATQLKYDIDGVVLGKYEAGIIVPEVVFRDEMAEEKVRFGINIARVFADRLGYTQADFEREYEDDLEFKYGADNQDLSITYRTESGEPVSVVSISRDALTDVTRVDLARYEKGVVNRDTEEKFEKGEI